MAKSILPSKNSLNIRYLVAALFTELTDEERCDHDEIVTKWAKQHIQILTAFTAGMILAVILTFFLRGASFLGVWFIFMGQTIYMLRTPSYTDKNWQVLQEIIERRDQGDKEPVLKEVKEGGNA